MTLESDMIVFAVYLAACVLAGQVIQSKHLHLQSEQHLAENYLTNYGYLKLARTTKTAALRSINSAVTSFQAFAGLKQTGELDAQTMEMMRTPRCGVKDVLDEDEDTPR